MPEYEPGQRAFELHKKMSRGRSRSGGKIGRWRDQSSRQKDEWAAAEQTLKHLLEMKAANAQN